MIRPDLRLTAIWRLANFVKQISKICGTLKQKSKAYKEDMSKHGFKERRKHLIRGTSLAAELTGELGGG